ncbi:MAG: hypothetical protein ACHQF2_09060 [Flavobacteriales bacterium]
MSLSSFTSKTDAVIDVRIPKNHFINLLEWEIYTTGERFIKITISHQSGKQLYKVERTLYGESYNELDASDFPRGKYTIEVECEGVKARAFTEKII